VDIYQRRRKRQDGYYSRSSMSRPLFGVLAKRRPKTPNDGRGRRRPPNGNRRERSISKLYDYSRSGEFCFLLKKPASLFSCVTSVTETISSIADHFVILTGYIFLKTVQIKCFTETISSIADHFVILTGYIFIETVQIKCFTETISSIAGHNFIFTEYIFIKTVQLKCFTETISSIAGHNFILTEYIFIKTVQIKCFTETISSIAGHNFILTEYIFIKTV